MSEAAVDIDADIFRLWGLGGQTYAALAAQFGLTRDEVAARLARARAAHYGNFTLEEAQQAKGCRWPAGDGADRRFCGRPMKPGTSLWFCDDHFQRALRR